MPEICLPLSSSVDADGLLPSSTTRIRQLRDRAKQATGPSSSKAALASCLATLLVVAAAWYATRPPPRPVSDDPLFQPFQTTRR